MTNLKKDITENGIHYTLHGDYYFPDLELPDSPRQTIGRYGRMRKAYLEEHRPGLYTRLILSGKPVSYTHLDVYKRQAHISFRNLLETDFN